MEQRRLRLGDILDDYCPRERRVTNHAVVAMIEETVKQTRCTTCDAEHPYKGGQAPKRRKKDPTDDLQDAGVVAQPSPEGVAGRQDVDRIAPPIANASNDARDDDAPVIGDVEAGAGTDEIDESEMDPVRDVEDGPVHRPLIRATLPRPEGQKDVRTPPDFTVRQSGGRGNNANANFRGGGGGGANARMRPRGHGGGNGHRPHGGQGGGRFSGARPGPGGQGRGQGGNFRSPQQPRHGGGGRKRSR
jgi:hypothetical protein